MPVSAVNLKSKHRAMARASPKARQRAAVGLVQDLVTSLQQIAPQDTRRYIRAWTLAGNMIGAKNPMPVLKRSSRHAEYIRRLEAQWFAAKRRVETLTNLRDRWYKDRKRTGYYRKLNTQINAAQRRVEKAEIELTKAGMNESFIFIGGRRGKRGVGLAGVREKIYGGRGRLVHGQFTTLIRLHNLEPHARIVERRSKALAKSERVAALLGLRKAKKSYINAVVAAAKAAPRT